MRYYMLFGINPATGNQVDQDFISYEDAVNALETNPVWKQLDQTEILEVESAE